ncbi:Aquaporin-10 [Phytophthora nicotianae]|uniref:Aquaporin-10 n=1 Tax=Phytophthora nicotianae TaxID=4792 RepID=A0A0W8CZJ6_PHYNI|nr:Aquaporin-10 [Phytophthora nicotianae]
MAPFPSNQTPDVSANPAPQPFEELDAKRDVSYIDMPLTPKTTSVNPADGRLASLSRFAVQSVHLRECFAEFLGTFVMIVFGMGVNNQVTNSQDANGTWLSINMCWGIGVLIGVYCTEVGTGMLLLGIYAITDQRNRPAGPVGAPFAFCLLIMALGMCIGMNTGYAINPARDFGPRLFTSIAGWGSKVFTLRDHYFWIPIVGPLIGGVIGAGLYVVLVEIHHPRQTLP